METCIVTVCLDEDEDEKSSNLHTKSLRRHHAVSVHKQYQTTTEWKEELNIQVVMTQTAVVINECPW